VSETTRDHLRTHPPRFVGSLADAAAAPDVFHPAAHEFVHALRCECGSNAFRLLGVPAAMAGGGLGYVLRSVLRVWRELRAGASGADGLAGRFSPPIVLECTDCGARRVLLAEEDDAGVASRRVPPLEAHRCRPCRRSTFEVAVVCAHHDAELDEPARRGQEEHFDAWRLVVRCRSCGMLGEPFALGRRTPQQRRIDRLYGREQAGHGEAR